MIRKEIVLPATRDEVWSALTDPEELERWFANDVELDLRPGGGASFRWGNGESRHATVREVEPGERLAFEWDEEGEVEFTLARRRRGNAADRRRDVAGLVDRARAAGTRPSRVSDPFGSGLLRARRSEPTPRPRLPRRPRDGDRDRADRRAADDAAGRRRSTSRR